MRTARSLALEKALTSRRFTGPADFARWVDTTDELTDDERALVLSATFDDIAATEAAMVAEIDQLRAEASR